MVYYRRLLVSKFAQIKLCPPTIEVAHPRVLQTNDYQVLCRIFSTNVAHAITRTRSWATVTTLQIERFLKLGDDREWSSQELVDWDRELYHDRGKCNGCLGGYHGFPYIKKYGISLESTYSYEGDDEFLRKLRRKFKALILESSHPICVGLRKLLNVHLCERATIRDYARVRPTEHDFLRALRDHAIFVNLRFYLPTIRYYSDNGGIYTLDLFIKLSEEYESKHLPLHKGSLRMFYEKHAVGHSVVAISYNVENGIAYAKCVNSWGERFGKDEKGHIRLEVMALGNTSWSTFGPMERYGSWYGVLGIYANAYYAIV